jgi:dolichyl-phosphate beta-glucosyltransferase
MADKGISVIIPAYNEQERLPGTLQKIHDYFRDTPEGFEIIVVSDGSTDSTASEVLSMASELSGIRLLMNDKNMGKGFSVRKGVLDSGGDLVLISDADLSTPVEDMEKLLPFLRGDYEIAIGSRGMKKSDIAIRQPWYREGMGKVFNLLVRLLVVGGIKDTQCGFKLFKGEAARRVFKKCRINGFCFDVETLFIAKDMGLRIKEVPTRWLNSPVSKVSIPGDPVKMFSDLFRIRVYKALGYYG